MQILDLDDGHVMLFVIDARPVGTATLRLPAGGQEASAHVSLAFANERRLALELSEEPVWPQTQVTALGRVLDDNGLVVIGMGGSMEMSVCRTERRSRWSSSTNAAMATDKRMTASTETVKGCDWALAST